MKLKEKTVKVFDAIQYFFFPKRCCSCCTVIRPENDFCDDCNIEKCRIPSPKCYYCGQETKFCACSDANRKFDMITAPFYYEDEARNCIKNFKFNSYFDNGKYLAREMVKTLERDFDTGEIDFIVPVSLSKRRKRERGFSQTEFLAKIISQMLGVECDTKSLLKTRDTNPQVGLKAKERRTNLKGAYSIKEGANLKGKTILLCDDIKTTGATLNECTGVLKNAGVKRVICITAAITKNKITGEKD